VNITNLKIGTRLGGGFGAMLILLILMLVVGIVNMGNMNAGTEALVNQNWVKAKLSNLALDNARGSIARIFEAVASTDSQQTAEVLQRLQTNVSGFNEAMTKLEPLIRTPEGKANLAKQKESRDRYVAAFGKTLTLIQAGDHDGAAKQAYGDTYKEMHAFADDLRGQNDLST